MRVNLLFFGTWARYLPEGSEGGRGAIEATDGSTVGQILDLLGMPADARTYLTLNGSRVKEEAVVSDGDELRVIIPLGGG